MGRRVNIGMAPGGCVILEDCNETELPLSRLMQALRVGEDDDIRNAERKKKCILWVNSTGR